MNIIMPSDRDQKSKCVFAVVDNIEPLSDFVSSLMQPYL